jgi:hypothetical protein
MSQELTAGKVLSPSTPWTERQVPGIQVAMNNKHSKQHLRNQPLNVLSVMP